MTTSGATRKPAYRAGHRVFRVLFAVILVGFPYLAQADNGAVTPSDVWNLRPGQGCIQNDSYWKNPQTLATTQTSGVAPNELTSVKVPCLPKNPRQAIYSCSGDTDRRTLFNRSWTKAYESAGANDPISACTCINAGTPHARFDVATSKAKLHAYLSRLSSTYGNQQILSGTGYASLERPIEDEGMASFFKEYVDTEIKQWRVDPNGVNPDAPSDFAQINWNGMVANAPGGDGPDKLNYCVYFVKFLMSQVTIKHDELYAASSGSSGSSGFDTESKLGIYLNPPAHTPKLKSDVIPIPDPRTPFTNAKLLKRDDGTAYNPTPAQYDTATRDYIAEQFDRLVRIYVAGSEQLNIDKKTPFKHTLPDGKPLKIRGLYQGYMPNLLESLPPIEFPYKIGGTEVCKSGTNLGIANTSNRWFAESKGSRPVPEVSNSQGWKNHVCANYVPHASKKTRSFPANSGILIHQIMVLAQNIRENQIKRGFLLPLTAYWTPSQPKAPPQNRGAWPRNTLKPIALTDADRMRGLIDQKRDQALEMLHQYESGFKDAATGKPAKPKSCAEQMSSSGTDQAAIAGQDTALDATDESQFKVQGYLAGACIIAAIQNRVEIDMVVRLAFYQWSYVAKAIMSRGNRYLLETVAFAPNEIQDPASPTGIALQSDSKMASGSPSTPIKNPIKKSSVPAPGLLLLGAGSLMSDRSRRRRSVRKNRRSALIRFGAFLLALLAIQAFAPESAEAGCKGRRKDRGTSCAYKAYNVSGGAGSTDICTASYRNDFEPAYNEMIAKLNKEITDAGADGAVTATIRMRIAELEKSKASVISECKKREFNAYTEYHMKWFLPSCQKTPKYDNVEEAERLCQIDPTGFDGDVPGTGSNPVTAIDSDVDNYNGLQDSNGDDSRSIIGEGDYTERTSIGSNGSTSDSQSSAALAGGTSIDAALYKGPDSGDGAGSGTIGGRDGLLNGSGMYGKGGAGGSGASGSGSSKSLLGGSSGSSLGSGSGDGLASKDGTGSKDGSGGISGAGNSDGSNSTYSIGGARSPASGANGGAFGGGYFGGGAGLFGSNASGAGGVGGDGGVNEVRFGRNPSSLGGLSPLGTADPSDYFSRIGADESLFKKVERRYGEKAMNWYIETARRK